VLRPIETLLLNWCDKKPVCYTTKFPHEINMYVNRGIWDSYINDYSASSYFDVLDRLCQGGYAEYDVDSRLLPEYKIGELRAVVKSKNLSPAKTKSLLFERIYAVTDKKELLEIFPRLRIYKITQKGLDEISSNSKNRIYIEIREQGYPLSDKLIENTFLKFPNGSHDEIIWWSFEMKLKEEKQSGLWRDCADTAFQMAKFLLRDNNELDSLIFMVVSVVGRVLYNIDNHRKYIDAYKKYNIFYEDRYTINGAKKNILSVRKLINILSINIDEFLKYYNYIKKYHFNEIIEKGSYDFIKVGDFLAKNIYCEEKKK